MKTYLYILCLSTLFLPAACSKEDTSVEDISPAVDVKQQNDTVPEGYFVVHFTNEPSPVKNVAVSGQDSRIQYVRYIVYKSSGEYVKEKLIWQPSRGAANWPLAAVTDTLPKGSYTAVFLGNVEQSLFPVPNAGLTTVLSNYKTDYASARIILPGVEFPDNTEYYMAKAGFSDQSNHPIVLLQRIIGASVVHRKFVVAQKALDTLVYHIVNTIHYKNTLTTLVNSTLNSNLRAILGPLGGVVLALVGGIDAIVASLLNSLVAPLTDLLYAQLLQGLTNNIGQTLAGNATQAGALSGLGVLLNPWQVNDASAAIVTMNNFPQSVDYGLTVKSYYPANTRFRYNFNTTNIYDEKHVTIKGLGGATWNISKINVMRPGLVTGLVVDGAVDTWLLTGTFVDINDQLNIAIAPNTRYKDTYSFADLQLKSYVQNGSGVTVSAKVGNIANIDGVLGGLLGVLNSLLGALGLGNLLTSLKNITVTTTLALPVLDGTNMTLTGSWGDPIPYVN